MASDTHNARRMAHKIPVHSTEKGKWIELTSEQWQFLCGIYAMNLRPGFPAAKRRRSPP
jgi:hypothetical protein